MLASASWRRCPPRRPALLPPLPIPRREGAAPAPSRRRARAGRAGDRARPARAQARTELKQGDPRPARRPRLGGASLWLPPAATARARVRSARTARDPRRRCGTDALALHDRPSAAPRRRAGRRVPRLHGPGDLPRAARRRSGPTCLPSSSSACSSATRPSRCWPRHGEPRRRGCPPRRSTSSGEER